MIWSRELVSQALNGCLQKKIDFKFSAIGCGIDSRKINDKEIFIAIRGKNFDGHNFIKHALKNGASVAIAQKYCPEYKGLPVIFVNNCIMAMQQLAKFFITFNKPSVIAITGSCGKTTTKDMLCRLLSYFGSVSSTIDNFNNKIGVPVSILNAKSNSRFLVLEMGMNRVGEIDELVSIANPDVAIVTNIGTSHIGNFKSKYQIAKAKAEIFKSGNCWAIINRDDEYSDFLICCAAQKTKNILTFGLQKKSDLQILSYENGLVEFKIKDENYNYKLPDYGMHFAYNSVCAIAAACALGICFDKKALDFAFSGFCPVAGRGDRHKLKINKKNILLIDDSYNASYESFCALLNWVLKLQGKKILILGQFAEVGKFAKQIYADIVKKLTLFDKIFIVGHDLKIAISKSLLGRALFYKDAEHLVQESDEVVKALENSSIIAIKGSRQMKLELIVEKIKNFDDKG